VLEKHGAIVVDHIQTTRSRSYRMLRPSAAPVRPLNHADGLRILRAQQLRQCGQCRQYLRHRGQRSAQQRLRHVQTAAPPALRTSCQIRLPPDQRSRSASTSAPHPTPMCAAALSAATRSPSAAPKEPSPTRNQRGKCTTSPSPRTCAFAVSTVHPSR
jgi:hypothetical protein